MMRTRRIAVLWLCGLFLASGVALAQEAGGDKARARKGNKNRREGKREGGQRGQRGPHTPFGANVPAVQEEMQRHREAIRTIMGSMKPNREAMRAKIKELREGGATKEEIRAALKPDPAKTTEAAGKIADELATHHKNLAAIFTANRDAIAASIVEKMGERMARRGGPRRKGGRDGDGDGPPDRPRGRRRGGDGDAQAKGAPKNF